MGHVITMTLIFPAHARLEICDAVADVRLGEEALRHSRIPTQLPENRISKCQSGQGCRPIHFRTRSPASASLIHQPAHTLAANRPKRSNEMSWLVSPLVAKSAIISPTTLQNLNPWPENPAAKKTFGKPGSASMMKCSSGVFVNMQALSAIVGPFASGK